MKKKQIKTPSGINPVSFVDQVRTRLGRKANSQRELTYLNLRDDHLNSVLGDPKLGLFYGQIVEISGKQSNGKSALAYDIAALAQSEGAFAHWIDFERSYNESWAARRGLDSEKVNLFQPYVGKFKGEKDSRLCTAQELLEEAEAVLVEVHQRFPAAKQILILDSVGAMLVEEEAEAGLTGQNMRTNAALPVMLGKLLRRWIGILGEVNCIGIFLNQLRTKPGMMFGDPDYTMGGNALPFYAHSRARMRRVKGGRVLQKGKVVGIKGILRNDKNKAGGVEGHEIGFKIMFNGASKFFDAAEFREEEPKK
jgi:recombination protein RecA